MKQNKQKRNILKYLVLILIIIIIFMFIRTELNSNISAIEAPQRNNEIIIPEKPLITEESSFPDNVYGVPVYTDLIDINEETRPRDQKKN